MFSVGIFLCEGLYAVGKLRFDVFVFVCFYSEGCRKVGGFLVGLDRNSI